MRFCNHCGNECFDNAKFCPICGNSMKLPNIEPINNIPEATLYNISESTINDISDSALNDIPESVSEDDKHEIKDVPHKTKGSFVKDFIIGVEVLLAIVAVIASVIFIVRKIEEKEVAKLKAETVAIVEDYNNEKISLVDAIDKLNEFTTNEREEVRKFAYDQKAVLDKISRSKNAFETANKCVADKEYVKAFETYDRVIEKDINYKAAQKRKGDAKYLYIKDLDEKIAVCVEEGKYTKAINLINEASKTFVDEDFLARKTKVENDFKEDYEIRMNSLEAEGNYLDAISICHELAEYFKDDFYEQKQENLKNDYAETIIEEAENYLAQGDYHAARKLVDAARINYEIHALVEEAARIEEYKPVSLLSLDTFAVEKSNRDLFLYKWEESDRDNEGNSGEEGILIKTIGDSRMNNVRYTYLLDGKYDRLTGRIAVHEEFKNCTSSDRYAGYILVYCDEELVYQSDVILGGVRSKDIDVDISGCDELVIRFEIGASLSVLDMNFGYGFLSPTLTKNYKPRN